MNWEQIDSKKALHIQNSIAGKGIRFAGAVIDRIVGYGLAMSFGMIMEIFSPGSLDFLVENSIYDKLITLAFILGYYLIFEAMFQKTIGKFILKLKVVNEFDATKPNFMTILKRTASRIIGLEAFVYLFGNHLWHDSWSDTVVISEKKFEEQEELDEIGNIGAAE
jgi:uncharacterized RDD family membrane protein YckC